MVFTRIFKRDATKEGAQLLYLALATQARDPYFYAVAGVPDSLDGRFDAVALHAFLVLNRLKRDPDLRAAALAQNLVDFFVADMDRSVRELGVGDMGVARRVKQMAQALYGRAAAYDQALVAADDALLTTALARNLYGTRENVPPGEVALVARYVRAAAAALAVQPLDALVGGQIVFPPPAGAAA
ncbi:MAG: ubiquinol-cytochrome C chaperone [Telmatospirillum sp.]|nr:ubiquinol-cytochrome C chaperone [Telmatospirillum sp.]